MRCIVARRWRARCNAALGLQCAVPAIPLQVVLLAWRVVLHECALLLQRRGSASDFRCCCSSLSALQLQAVCHPGGALLAARGVSMHPLESRYGCMVSSKKDFAFRTGFSAARGRKKRALLCIASCTELKLAASLLITAAVAAAPRGDGVVANGVEADGAIVIMVI